MSSAMTFFGDGALQRRILCHSVVGGPDYIACRVVAAQAIPLLESARSRSDDRLAGEKPKGSWRGNGVDVAPPGRGVRTS
jgi:hypothetical protein